MKKIFITLSAAVFALVACNKEIPVVENEPAEATKLAFNFQVNHPDDTKAVKTAWESGDKIYVFFEDIYGEGKYLTLTYNGSAWTSSTNNLAVSEFGGDESTVTMHAVFFPFEQPEITAVGEGFTFKTKSEGHTTATAGLGIYTYYMTSSATCTVTVDSEIKTLGGTLSMELPAGFVQFYIPANGSEYNEDYRYRLSIEGIKPLACVAYNADYSYGTSSYHKTVPAITNNFSTKELAAAQPMWGYKYGEGIAFSGVIDGAWNKEKSHIAYLFDTEAAAKITTIPTGKELASHNAVIFSSVGSWGPAATADSSPLAYSGTAWARFNLGATAEGTAAANYGWYFAWGDIIPVLGTEAEDAPVGYAVHDFYTSNLSGYYDFTVASEALYARAHSLYEDGYEIYDAARVFLGAPWRMPIKSEVEALIASNTNFDAPDDAFTANGVIFPDTGRWKADGYNYDHVGVYWTASISASGVRYGNRLNFNASAKTIDITYGSDRQFGYPVRPVKDATVVPASGTSGENLAAWD
ncbi:MAG: hypothetical protein IJP81_09860 [Bacteroidales bacterium]|nr:hypothetical protein [Bacteroidales bacterium]